MRFFLVSCLTRVLFQNKKGPERQEKAPKALKFQIPPITVHFSLGVVQSVHVPGFTELLLYVLKRRASKAGRAAASGATSREPENTGLNTARCTAMEMRAEREEM